nr:probable galacturonosyltransferase 15 [Ipomoea batatas]
MKFYISATGIKKVTISNSGSVEGGEVFAGGMKAKGSPRIESLFSSLNPLPFAPPLSAVLDWRISAGVIRSAQRRADEGNCWRLQALDGENGIGGMEGLTPVTAYSMTYESEIGVATLNEGDDGTDGSITGSRSPFTGHLASHGVPIMDALSFSQAG